MFNSIVACVLLALAGPAPKAHWVFVGTMEKGIYRGQFDERAGTLTTPVMAAPVQGPGFLAKHPKLPVLYAVAQGKDWQGILCSYKLDAKTGALTPLNQVAGGDCYVSVSRDGGTLFAANYGEGSVASYRLGKDGAIGARVSFIQQHGSGAVPQQSGPHAHCIDQDPTGRYVFVCDLGADKLFSYRFDPVTSALTPNDPPFTAFASGDGPRHLAFDKRGRFLYVVNELGGTVSALRYDGRRGVASMLESVSSLPKGFHGRSWGAEVAVGPGGRFLYSSNRADDESIAVFGIAKDGRLALDQVFHGDIHHPRHFTLDPEGKHLLIGNMEGDSVLVCQIDPRTGRLKAQRAAVKTPKPACVLFVD